MTSLPAMDKEMCQWVPAKASSTLLASLPLQPGALSAMSQGLQALASTEATRAEAAKRNPVRVMRDSYAAYAGIAVDATRNEVVMTDENLFSILTYDRLENTPAQAAMSEPKRIIRGMKTDIEFNSSVYLDPATGDIYAVNNDTVNKVAIFPRLAQGDLLPARTLETPHTTHGIAVGEQNREMFLTVQDDAAVLVYSKLAQGTDAPLRVLQGEQTLLADPHGLALDSQKGLLFVSNWGSVSARRSPPTGAQRGNIGRGVLNWPIGWNYAVPGSGKFLPPSITVYRKDARGDTPPLRVIQGLKTQLNWPTALAIDPVRGELFVANDPTHSVLVFSATASGDMAPVRVLEGPKTLLQNPVGISLDLKNNELWVANFGNHTATVFRRDASGNMPPLRVIRSAPLDQPAPMMGNPHTIRYDSEREEILVAN
jgi:DNA-binding beta-propeller fold protein YncE